MQSKPPFFLKDSSIPAGVEAKLHPIILNVFNLTKSGKTTKQISEELGRSESDVSYFKARLRTMIKKATTPESGNPLDWLGPAAQRALQIVLKTNNVTLIDVQRYVEQTPTWRSECFRAMVELTQTKSCKYNTATCRIIRNMESVFADVGIRFENSLDTIPDSFANYPHKKLYSYLCFANSSQTLSFIKNNFPYECSTARSWYHPWHLMPLEELKKEVHAHLGYDVGQIDALFEKRIRTALIGDTRVKIGDETNVCVMASTAKQLASFGVFTLSELKAFTNDPQWRNKLLQSYVSVQTAVKTIEDIEDALGLNHIKLNIRVSVEIAPP